MDLCKPASHMALCFGVYVGGGRCCYVSDCICWCSMFRKVQFQAVQQLSSAAAAAAAAAVYCGCCGCIGHLVLCVTVMILLNTPTRAPCWCVLESNLAKETNLQCQRHWMQQQVQGCSDFGSRASVRHSCLPAAPCLRDRGQYRPWQLHVMKRQRTGL